MKRTLVAAGPTISAAEIASILPAAETVPPIAFGDALSYQLGAGDELLILDGLFLQRPSVRHKELLSLLDDGVLVAGASSMGALRAAELHRHGMVGFGEIFEAYRDGLIDADDEVGMVHGQAQDGYPVFVDALVNIRATLRRAVAAEVLDQPTADRMIAVACQLPFTARSWQNLLQHAGIEHSRALVRRLRDLRTDQKHADARTALTALAAGVPSSVPQWPRPAATIWSKRWAERWQPGTPIAVGQPPTTVKVCDLDVLNLLRLSAEPGWLYEPALEQMAAWHVAVLAKLPSTCSVPTAATRAIQYLDLHRPEAAADSRLRKLERIAHLHLQHRGLCDQAGLPPYVLANWLTRSELTAAECDPVLGSALLASRTLLHDPALPELSHLLDLLRKDARLPLWQQQTAQALQFGIALGLQRPGFNLRKPKPDRLDELFRRRWHADNLRVAKAVRGYVTDESFYLAAVPFAAAAATGTLPELYVGQLGRTALVVDKGCGPGSAQ